MTNFSNPTRSDLEERRKHGGWKTFTQPHFRNQGQCVAWVATHGRHGGK